MFKYLPISFALIFFLMITSCGPAKKLVKTDTEIEVETTINKIDTTKRDAAWQNVVDQVISQIDLSKVKVVTYYPTIDSSGRQAIKEEYTIEKNIVTNSAQKSEEKAVISEEKGIKEITSQNFQSREIEIVKEKKTGIPIKYYFIGFLLLAGIGYLAYKFIRHQFF